VGKEKRAQTRLLLSVQALLVFFLSFFFNIFSVFLYISCFFGFKCELDPLTGLFCFKATHTGLGPVIMGVLAMAPPEAR
jgi:hypothetical protein